MTTNPLFAPQNLRAQYNPGMPASLAYALMPTDNFAQKRADNAVAVQYQSMVMGMADQAAAEKEKALLGFQKSLHLIDQQDILQPDMRRLSESMGEPWRAGMENEIVQQYGGDIMRWRRERLPYHVMKMERELKTHPDFQRAVANKTSYSQWQEDKTKGKLAVGDMDSEWANYVSGKTNSINYRGGYDPPKQGFDYFDKTTHATAPYGVNGKPMAVSQDDLLAHLMSQGLSGEQAADYVGKIGYQGGRFWKMEKQKPWEASEDAWDRQMDSSKLRLAQAGQAEDRRHNKATEANAAEKAKAGTANGVPTIINEVYNPEGATRAYKTTDGQVVMKKAGATGEIGKALMAAAGVNPNLNQSSSYASTEPLLPDKKTPNPEYDRKLHTSSVTELYSTDFTKKYHNNINSSAGSAPMPFTFDNVDPRTIYYYGGKPFLHGVARIDGKPRKVAIKIDENYITKGELTNEGGLFNSKDKRQQYSDSEQQMAPVRQRRTSTGRMVDDFLNN